ncbi:MAG: ECF-type sigma factor [Gammaproteobacteria bacterium]|nr:ECF-type sigma factor [Gammaproteobacteria bacterium]
MDETTTAIEGIDQPKRDSRKSNQEDAAHLFPAAYQELKRLAHSQLRKAWSIETIQTTALLNETYLKLIAHQPLVCSDKRHFFALCAKAMRQILINYAEQKQTQKRGGDLVRVTYAEVLHQSDMHDNYRLDTLLTIDQALEQLSGVDEKLSELVELRFFAGLTEADLAQLFEVNERTIRRNWSKAKALLALVLNSEDMQNTS